MKEKVPGSENSWTDESCDESCMVLPNLALHNLYSPYSTVYERVGPVPGNDRIGPSAFRPSAGIRFTRSSRLFTPILPCPFMLSSILAALKSPPPAEETQQRPPRYANEDTSPTSQREILGWYAYGVAAEVFAVCGVGM